MTNSSIRFTRIENSILDLLDNIQIKPTKDNDALRKQLKRYGIIGQVHAIFLDGYDGPTVPVQAKASKRSTTLKPSEGPSTRTGTTGRAGGASLQQTNKHKPLPPTPTDFEESKFSIVQEEASSPPEAIITNKNLRTKASLILANLAKTGFAPLTDDARRTLSVIAEVMSDARDNDNDEECDYSFASRFSIASTTPSIYSTMSMVDPDHAHRPISQFKAAPDAPPVPFLDPRFKDPNYKPETFETAKTKSAKSGSKPTRDAASTKPELSGGTGTGTPTANDRGLTYSRSVNVAQPSKSPKTQEAVPASSKRPKLSGASAGTGTTGRGLKRSHSINVAQPPKGPILTQEAAQTPSNKPELSGASTGTGATGRGLTRSRSANVAPSKGVNAIKGAAPLASSAAETKLKASPWSVLSRAVQIKIKPSVASLPSVAPVRSVSASHHGGNHGHLGNRTLGHGGHKWNVDQVESDEEFPKERLASVSAFGNPNRPPSKIVWKVPAAHP